MDADAVWTFFLIKPDAIERTLAAEIRVRIESAGFVVKTWKEVVLQPRDVDALFPEVAMRAMVDNLLATVRRHQIEYLCSGPCIYSEVTMDSADNDLDIFSQAKNLRGGRFLPEHCEEGSIRFDYRENVRSASRRAIGVTDSGTPVIDGIVKNLIHCPSDGDERDRQASVLFGLAGGM